VGLATGALREGYQVEDRAGKYSEFFPLSLFTLDKVFSI
jgi:hypothetical protein